MSLLIVILGAVTVRRMPVDIFPEIDIPVIAVVWTYIVRRNIDTGSLVTPAGGTTNNTGMSGAGAAGNADAGGLFRIARLDSIRTYINVPQTYAAAITPGLIAEVEVRELPQNRFEGRVTRTTSALDPASRTLPTEVLIGNGEGRLLPGMYVQIRFSVPRAVRPVLIPAGALVTRAEGARVIVIRPDGTTHYQPVEVGRDYGSRLEITDGLNAGEMVVTSPTDALREGGRVEARPAALGGS